MKRFNVVYSPEADIDLEILSDVIMFKYKAPLTAKRYFVGLRAEIKRLNYKEMAVIFATFGNIVYIHRVIPANTIADL